jgi:hypothetical protein
LHFPGVSNVIDPKWSLEYFSWTTHMYHLLTPVLYVAPRIQWADTSGYFSLLLVTCPWSC